MKTRVTAVGATIAPSVKQQGEQTDSEITPRSLREVEAEAVAMLCCAALE